MSVIGLDLGTSRVKAVRFDAAWRAADIEAEATAVSHPSPGWSEQDMTGVWAAAARVLGQVARRCADPVELVAVTGQGDGCWLVDTDGEPARPAPLWNDNRAARIVSTWEREGVLTDAFRINGCYGSPGLANAQLHWLARHEPDTLSRASTLLSCASWVYQQLTGAQVLDASEAANPFLDAVSQRYDDRLLAMYDLTEFARLLPPVVTGADRIAPLLGRAAGEVGLSAGTPIALAPYDVVASTIGAGVTATGDGIAVLGTTLCAGVVRDTPALDRAPNGITLPSGTPQRYLLAFPTMVGTEVLDWTATLLGLERVDDLMALAAQAGAGPPLLLPYLSPGGERSPFLDSDIRGSLHGLTLAHTRADIARAVVNGLSLAIRDCLTAANGTASLALAGGGARSEYWAQTIADATNTTVRCTNTPEVGARGAVLVGATDLGVFASLDEATRVVDSAHTHTPDPARVARYDDLYTRYLDLRARLSAR
jgi:erythritol kinase (D-erythritol 1-phosphate-forming)